MTQAAVTSADTEFLRRLEGGDLPAIEFDHVAHIRAGYLYLRAYGFAQALDRMRKAVGNFATRHGKPGRYHETITVAYLALIQQHIVERGDAGGWLQFERENKDLFARNLLLEYYDPLRLQSDLARRTFLLPKRMSQPVSPATTAS